MSLTDRIGEAGKILKAMALVIALVPGIAVITDLVDIPPTLVQLVTMLSFVVSIVVFITVVLLTEQIRILQGKTAAILCFVSFIAGACLLTGYFRFAEAHIAKAEEGDNVKRHLIPLRPSDRIREIMAPYGRDYDEALQTSLERRELGRLMDEEGGGSAMIMIALMVMSQALLIGSIVAGVWKLTSLQPAEPTGSGATPPAQDRTTTTSRA